eukprot:TRINITY_DN21248_c0_g1_i1.p1 TRINITY_DN21248_c0_g1~~TRINITY_DN21248_c0_g1_i1.p1  ORF type:complete len:328 (+),score=54.53 TRINITY_DN21248_c0_g1_i1:186-1169(+)
MAVSKKSVSCIPCLRVKPVIASTPASASSSRPGSSLPAASELIIGKSGSAAVAAKVTGDTGQAAARLPPRRPTKPEEDQESPLPGEKTDGGTAGKRAASVGAPRRVAAGGSLPAGAKAQFQPGDVVEVIESFTSDEKEFALGNAAGVLLPCRHKGMVKSIDEDGEACIRFQSLGQSVYVSKHKLVNLKKAQASSAESPGDVAAYQALVKKQEAKLGGILKELETNKKKVSHWAWWVFPTEKEGNHDPAGTRVTKATAARLIEHHPAVMQQWQQVLEVICDLVEEYGTKVLPRIDHNRVMHFIAFWSELDASPEWMKAVCKRLSKFKW